jgi:hypothetical protein
MENRNLYFSFIIVTITELTSVCCVEHIASVRKYEIKQKILVKKLNVKASLEDIILCGGIILK